MNWLDHAIGWINPAGAVRRVSARRALEIHARAYDAAKRDHRTWNWHTAGSSANAEVGSAEELVRNRSRDLVRNNGYALQIIETIADHVIGTGIVSAPTGLRGRNLKRAKDLWTSFVENCDFDNDQDLNGLMWSAEKGKNESGSAIIRFRRQSFDSSTTAPPLKLQLIEPDFIDTSKSGTFGGNLIDRGIEYDTEGRRVAYWLFPAHPGDVASWRSRLMESQRVPADELIYLFDKLRPGQDRGMPVLSPAIMTLQDLRSYFAAELVRKRVAACMVGVITTQDDNVQLGVRPNEKPTYGRQDQKFEPGMWTRLLPGEDVKFNTPPMDAAVDMMATQYLREASAAAGVMFEQTTGDFSRVNYSSFRAGGHGFRRRTERRQWNFIHRVCRPIAARFTEASLAAQLMPAVPSWRHTPPGFISVDPDRDAKADLANLRMGKVTLSELVEERGYDYVEHLQRYADDLEAAAQALGAGVMFDGDPRKVLNQATPEKAKTTGDAGNDDDAANQAA